MYLQWYFTLELFVFFNAFIVKTYIYIQQTCTKLQNITQLEQVSMVVFFEMITKDFAKA